MGNHQTKPVNSIGIVEAAIDKGQPKDGVGKGPYAIREEGLNAFLSSMGQTTVKEYPKITQTEAREEERILNCLNQKAFLKSSAEIISVVEKSVAENDLTFVLGGDHSLGYGSIRGHFNAFPNTFVVWVDAHSDINTPDVSGSGNIHGMPVSFLMKETSDKIPKTQGFEKLLPCLTSKNLLYIGLRDVDTPELEYLKEFNIRYFTMADVKEIGIEKVMQLSIKAISEQPNCQIHLSFDIDALDPQFASSTGTPVPGGLTLDEGKHICRSLAVTGMLKSVDLVEVNPALGSPEDSKTTVNSAIELLKSCINPKL
ncbi:Amino-acid acetyltransferase, mitochondrial [Sparganum proliferum]